MHQHPHHHQNQQNQIIKIANVNLIQGSFQPNELKPLRSLRVEPQIRRPLVLNQGMSANVNLTQGGREGGIFSSQMNSNPLSVSDLSPRPGFKARDVKSSRTRHVTTSQLSIIILTIILMSHFLFTTDWAASAKI